MTQLDFVMQDAGFVHTEHDRPKEIISIEKYMNWASQAKKLGFLG